MKRSPDYEVETDRMIKIKAWDSKCVTVCNRFLINFSPAFRDRVENLRGENDEIAVDGISSNNLDILIKFIYTTFRNCPGDLPVNEDNVLQFMQVATEFNLEDVQGLCQQYLDQIEITAENCVSLLHKCVLSPAMSNAMKHKLFHVILENLGQVSSTQPFLELHIKLIVDIFQEGKANGQCSDEVLLQAAKSWLKVSEAHRIEENVRSLFAVFSLDENMTLLDFLHEFPDCNKVAFKLMRELFQGSRNPNPNSNPRSIELIIRVDPCQDDGENSGQSSSSQLRASSNDGGYSASTNVNASLSSSSQQQQQRQKQAEKRGGSSSGSNSGSASKKVKSEVVYLETRSIFPLRPGSPEVIEIPDSPQRVDSDSPVLQDVAEDDEGGLVYFIDRPTKYCQPRFLYVFNLNDGSLEKVKNLPPALCSLRSITLFYHRGRIYLMGGSKARTNMSCKDVHVLDLETKRWTKNKMIESRYDFNAVLLSDYIYAVGGCQKEDELDEKGVGINCIDKFCVARGNDENDEDNDEGSPKYWQKEGYLDICRSDAGTVAFNGKIFAIGGYAEDDASGQMAASSTVEMYDPSIRDPEARNSMLASLNVARMGLTAVSTGDKIYTIGGIPKVKSKRGMDTVEIYSPRTQTWRIGPPTQKKRAFASSVFYKDAVYVFGGEGKKRKPTIEKLDLNSESKKRAKWTQVFANSLVPEGVYSSVAFSG